MFAFGGTRGRIQWGLDVYERGSVSGGLLSGPLPHLRDSGAGPRVRPGRRGGSHWPLVLTLRRQGLPCHSSGSAGGQGGAEGLCSQFDTQSRLNIRF